CLPAHSPVSVSERGPSSRRSEPTRQAAPALAEPGLLEHLRLQNKRPHRIALTNRADGSADDNAGLTRARSTSPQAASLSMALPARFYYSGSEISHERRA